MIPLHIAAISGSLRKDSYNKKVLQKGIEIANGYGHHVQNLDLAGYDLPIYNFDIEEIAFPESVIAFKSAIESADMLMIATPEYNHSIPGGLKNAIDWASRGKNSFSKKTVALFGASDGKMGTVRSQMHMRVVLSSLNAYVTPYPEVYIRQAQNLLDDQGMFDDERSIKQLDRLISKTINITYALKPLWEVKKNGTT